MELVFILVQPAVPENVGFSCRALKTMGFNQLRLVNPVDVDQPAARKTAYASHDILFGAEKFSSFTAAVADCDLVIGTTAKKRRMRVTPLSASDLPNWLMEKEDTIQQVALVFGSEENGLSREQIADCDVVSTISLATDYPSLNLSQSVMVYAYELSSLIKSTRITQKEKPENYKYMMEQARQLLTDLDVDRQPALKQQLLDRLAYVGGNDVYLLLSLFKYIRYQIRKAHETQ